MGPDARRARIALVVAGLLALCAPAGAGASTSAFPDPGTFVSGSSLGGLRLGMTREIVRKAWGSDFGRCRSCALTTWYFTYRPFAPQGAAVVFVRERVVRVFTLWQPEGWRTADGLVLGASESTVTRALGTLPRVDCGTYDALVVRGDRAASAFYLYRGELWGFGLMRPAASACVGPAQPRPGRGVLRAA